MNKAEQLSAAQKLISSLKTGDRVRVTFDGHTREMTVSREARRSDDGPFGDPSSLDVTRTVPAATPGKCPCRTSRTATCRWRRSKRSG